MVIREKRRPSGRPAGPEVSSPLPSTQAAGQRQPRPLLPPQEAFPKGGGSQKESERANTLVFSEQCLFRVTSQSPLGGGGTQKCDTASRI